MVVIGPELALTERVGNFVDTGPKCQLADIDIIHQTQKLRVINFNVSDLLLPSPDLFQQPFLKIKTHLFSHLPSRLHFNRCIPGTGVWAA